MSEVGFLVGRAVVAVRRNPDGRARIIFDLRDGPEPALYADIAACTFEDRSGATLLPASMVSSVVSDTSTDDGTLMLSYADGSLLRCEPDARYEAWQVIGGSPQYLVVCQPGGELAVWDSSHVPTETEAQETAELLTRTLGWDVRVREVAETGGMMLL